MEKLPTKHFVVCYNNGRNVSRDTAYHTVEPLHEAVGSGYGNFDLAFTTCALSVDLTGPIACGALARAIAFHTGNHIVVAGACTFTAFTVTNFDNGRRIKTIFTTFFANTETHCILLFLVIKNTQAHNVK